MNAPVEQTVSALRARLDAHRVAGDRVGVVPTMGALHEGHLSLIREAARRAEVVVVTIFVNPTQFGPGEDFDRYPRTFDQDVDLALKAGAHVIFAPSAEEMYPRGEKTRIRVADLSEGMCGAVRPGHFDGVATVVAKLYSVVGAGTYFFGKKDYQQWRIVERLARDLLAPVEVVGLPTVRETDGLAMSSRNRFLLPEQRLSALAIVRGLSLASARYRGGERDPGVLFDLVAEELGRCSLAAEYIEVREAETLTSAPARLGEGNWLLALAVRVGTTRLIDNVILGEDLLSGT